MLFGLGNKITEKNISPSHTRKFTKGFMAAKGSFELRFDERQAIERLLKEKYKIVGIADILGRSHSCIKQEIRKNGGKSNYSSNRSQSACDMRKETMKEYFDMLVAIYNWKNRNPINPYSFYIDADQSPDSAEHSEITLGM